MEKALAERDKLRVQVAAKDAIILAKDEQILALQGLLQTERQISQDWKTAALERKSAITIDDKMITAFEKRNAELQAERDAARRNNKVWGAVGLVFGTALGFYANRK